MKRKKRNWLKQKKEKRKTIYNVSYLIYFSIFHSLRIDIISSGKCDKNRSVHFIFIETKNRLNLSRLKTAWTYRNCVRYNRMELKTRTKENKKNKKKTKKRMRVAFNGRMTERRIRVLLVSDVEQRNRSIEYTNKQSAIRFNDNEQLATKGPS